MKEPMGLETTTSTVQAYLRTTVLTASPEELRLLLLDGAIKFAAQGRDGLTARNYEVSYNGFSQSRNIILELVNSVRPEVAPELCRKVTSLYTYMYTLLLSASVDKDTAKADEAIALLEFERETWAMLMDKVAAEKEAGSRVRAAASAAAAVAAPERSERVPLSIEG